MAEHNERFDRVIKDLLAEFDEYDEYINRADILAEAKRLSGPMTGDGWDNLGVYALIERQPSADVVPVVHGHWIKDCNMAFFWKCSECGAYLFWREEEYLVNGNANYCPNCGAKMDEEEKE